MPKRILSPFSVDKDREKRNGIFLLSVLSQYNRQDPWQYIKKLRTRGPELDSSWDTICTLTALTASDGKIPCNSRIHTRPFSNHTIPSPKAEPFKLWLVQVGAEWVQETIDPEQAIERAKLIYLAKEYSQE